MQLLRQALHPAGSSSGGGDENVHNGLIGGRIAHSRFLGTDPYKCISIMIITWLLSTKYQYKLGYLHLLGKQQVAGGGGLNILYSLWKNFNNSHYMTNYRMRISTRK